MLKLAEKKENEPLAIALISEIMTAEQLIRGKISKALPKGMEPSHFSVLNHLVRSGTEKSPAQLARSFHVTKGAMTNTLGKLEAAGYVHIRPDWDDARRKQVSVSSSGKRVREEALQAITPIFDDLIANLGADRVRAALPFLRDLRIQMD
jgi:DNA-binding MarR family transcriptional regulator